MPTLTTSELLHALHVNAAKRLKCPDCHGTGTKFGVGAKSSPCPKCKGTRAIVQVQRQPVELPYTADWEPFVGDKR